MHCRFVVNTLSKFDTRVPMISMSMAEFLQAARSGAKDTWAEGETQPIHRSAAHPSSIPSSAPPTKKKARKQKTHLDTVMRSCVILVPCSTPSVCVACTVAVVICMHAPN